jgi:eukaryotic-like serine/threonine-protein kinase
MPNDARETEQLSQTVRGHSPPEPDTLGAGDVLLDRFRLIRLVGRGGMGDVYEARDLRLHVTVALKTVRASLVGGTELLDRLRREVQLARAVTDPHVCRVFDFHEGVAPDGKPHSFVTMEFLVGETLAERLRSGPFPARAALVLLRQMAAGLAAIHAKSLVHRDFKPGNVMLVAERAELRAVVTDFGIARLASTDDADTGWDQTATGAVIGTPAYMAPEQRCGGDVTARADIFSLGLVAYEMVTGRLPVGSGLEGVPRGWAQPLQRALEADSARRYGDPRQLVSTLEHGPHKIVARGMALAGLTLAVVLAGLLAVRARPVPSKPAADRHAIAVLPLTNIGGSAEDEYFGEGLAEDILTQLAKIRGLHVISRTSTHAYKGTNKPLREIAAELGVGTVLEGSVRRSGGRVRVTTQLIDALTDQHLWAETYDREAHDVLDLQSDVASKVASALALQLTQPDAARLRRGSTTNPEAYDYYLRSLAQFDDWRESAAIENLEKAVAIDPAYALARAQLAYAYARQGSEIDFSEASWIDKAKAEAKRALELEPDLALPHVVQGELLFSQHSDWDFDGAIRELQRAEELEPGIAQVQLGAFFSHVGLEEPGLRSAELGLRLDPLNSYAKGQIPPAYEMSGRWLEAVGRARALYPEPEATEHVTNSLLRLGRIDEAEGVLARKDQPLTRALILALRGRKGQAAELMKSVVQQESRSHARSFHHQTYQRACIEAVLGHPEEAIALLRETVETGMPNYLLFSRDQFLNPLHSHPGFVKLMAEIKPRWDKWREAYH